MSTTVQLTDNELRAVQLLRALKAGNGYGTLRIEVTAGQESLFRSERCELPPDKKKK